MRAKQTTTAWTVRRPIIIAVILIIAVSALALWAAHHTTTNTSTINPAGSTSPTPNQGNAAKSSQSNVDATPAPKSSATPAAGSSNAPSAISVSDFTVTPQSDGTSVRVASTITGATAGTCTLTLSHAGSQSVTATGSVITSGTYYFCSFGTVSGARDSGTWSANLTVASNGATGSGTTSFTR